MNRLDVSWQSSLLFDWQLVMWLFFWHTAHNVWALTQCFRQTKAICGAFFFSSDSFTFLLSTWPQSTSNVWMTHAEMESLNAATKPPVSSPGSAVSCLTKPHVYLFDYYFTQGFFFFFFRLVRIMLTSLSPPSTSSHSLSSLFCFLVSLCLFIYVSLSFCGPRP